MVVHPESMAPASASGAAAEKRRRLVMDLRVPGFYALIVGTAATHLRWLRLKRQLVAIATV
jgi:hypothetical protein